MTWLQLLWLFLIVGCATQAPPRAILPTAPTQAPSALPGAAKAKASASATAQVSSQLEAQVSKLQSAAKNTQEIIENALNETARLQGQKAASEQELSRLWDSISTIKARNLFVETEAANAMKMAEQQKTLRVNAENDLHEVELLAVAVEAEVIDLRSDRINLMEAIHSLQNRGQKLEKQLVSAEKQAFIGSYLRRWLIGIAVVIVLFIAAQLYFPILRFGR